MSVEENIRIIESAEEAFNKRDWDTFDDRHMDSVISYSPTNPEPTKGIDAHRESVKGLHSAFPNSHMKRERTIGQGDWVTATYILTGIQKGPLKGAGGKMIPPTNKSVLIPFVAVMRFEAGKIAEEHVYYDRLAMLYQLGVAL